MTRARTRTAEREPMRRMPWGPMLCVLVLGAALAGCDGPNRGFNTQPSAASGLILDLVASPNTVPGARAGSTAAPTSRRVLAGPGQGVEHPGTAGRRRPGALRDDALLLHGQPDLGYGLQPNRDHGSRSRHRDVLRDHRPRDVHHHGQRRGRLRHRAHHGLLRGPAPWTRNRHLPAGDAAASGGPPVDPRRLRPPHDRHADPGVLGQRRDQRAEVRRRPSGDHGLREHGRPTSRLRSAINPNSITPGQRAGVTAFVTNRNGQPLGGKMVQFSTSVGSLDTTVGTTNPAGQFSTFLRSRRRTPRNTRARICDGRRPSSRGRSGRERSTSAPCGCANRMRRRTVPTTPIDTTLPPAGIANRALRTCGSGQLHGHRTVPTTLRRRRRYDHLRAGSTARILGPAGRSRPAAPRT